MLHLCSLVGVVDLPTITSNESNILSVVGGRAAGPWLRRHVHYIQTSVLTLLYIRIFIKLHLYLRNIHMTYVLTIWHHIISHLYQHYIALHLYLFDITSHVAYFNFIEKATKKTYLI